MNENAFRVKHIDLEKLSKINKKTYQNSALERFKNSLNQFNELLENSPLSKTYFISSASVLAFLILIIAVIICIKFKPYRMCMKKKYHNVNKGNGEEMETFETHDLSPSAPTYTTRPLPNLPRKR